MESLFKRYAGELTVAAGVALVLLVAVGLPSLLLRSELREQVLLREGQTLHAVVSMQYAIEASAMEGLGLSSAEVDDFSTILQTARLPGVIGVRLFAEGIDSQDVFPPTLSDGALEQADWERLRAGAPVARMHARYPLSRLVLSADLMDGAELVEIVVPLPARAPGLKVAQYWIAGSGIAAEFARHDRGLLIQALIVWLLGSGVAVAIIGLASKRLRSANAELRRRGDDLARANQELSLAAKVSAVGVVAAHLIHGLKNPLQGLRGLTMDRSRMRGSAEVNGYGDSAWEDAARMTGRLQAIVDEVTALLRDEASGVQFRVDSEDLKGMTLKRTADICQSTGVTLSWNCQARLDIDSRVAALVSLIVSNLVTNACEASESGSEVHVGIGRRGDAIEFAVSDRGSGVPTSLRDRLFLPVTSTKPRGSGIGLAVSRNLAQHVGAVLELEETGPAGSVFVLRLPQSEDVKIV